MMKGYEPEEFCEATDRSFISLVNKFKKEN